MYVFEGFVIGILGSLHCIGMCGPLALALPLVKEKRLKRLTGGLVYNIGRAITYAGLGLVFGLLGAGIKLTGFQQWVSILCGVIMILSVFFPGLIKVTYGTQKATSSYLGGIKAKIGRLLNKSKHRYLLLIGLLNGLLPCGLVYIAISGAINASSIPESVLFMFLFGLGTLPMMFAVVYFGNVLKGKLFAPLQKLIPVFIFILGVLFILRGMNLGIKYISPKFGETPEEHSCCH